MLTAKALVDQLSLGGPRLAVDDDVLGLAENRPNDDSVAPASVAVLVGRSVVLVVVAPALAKVVGAELDLHAVS